MDKSRKEMEELKVQVEGIRPEVSRCPLGFEVDLVIFADMNNRIYNVDLIFKGRQVPFAIQTIEEIYARLKGEPDDPHRHKYFTLIWVFSGSGVHVIDYRSYPILRDQMFFVSPDQVHQVMIRDNPTGIVIQFTCDFLERNSIRQDFISDLRLFRNCDETPPLPIGKEMKDRLKVFSDGMMDAFHSNAEMRYETIGAYLKLFLIECNMHCSLYPDNNPQSTEVGRSLVRTFKNLVEKHFHQKHQVQDYAEMLNVTPGYLNEVIRSAVGQSAKDYIQNRLVLEVKRMGMFTSKSNKEIGFDLGFEDPSHFSKFYKSHTGQSLQEFRKQ